MLTTNNGISSFNSATKHFSNYTAGNGVDNAPFYEGSGPVSKELGVFLGGEAGFNFFTPSDINNVSTSAKVILTQLNVSNEVVSAGKNSPIELQVNFAKEINLKYGENFSIDYAAMDYANARNNQYAHKLEWVEDGWNEVSGNQSVSYTNLDPGQYVFHVKASSDGRNWSNEEKTIIINILPPWWRTVYAFMFYGISILADLYFHRKNSIQKLTMQFELQQEKANAKEAIERQRVEAERLRLLDNLKIKFLTNLSHEFRTPLSLISGPVDKLLKIPDANVLAETNVIQRNAKRLP